MTQRDAISAAAALDDPLRNSLLQLVSASTHAITRDAAAQALGVPRSTVAFNLDRLVDAGLLQVRYERVNGRDGPGAGRPSKTYTKAAGELTVSIPQRHYDLMGGLLAAAIEDATGAVSAFEALRSAAQAAGRRAGIEAETFEQLLDDTGYVPASGVDGTVLRNCPFHRLAKGHTTVVCAANHAYLCGAAQTTGIDPSTILLEPSADGCCIRIEA